MATVKITEVEGNELYHRYTGQTKPQDVYVLLDAESGNLWADAAAEIGSGVPMRVWHGHVCRWRIPAFRAAAANALLEEIAPLAQRVCDGYESRWDGSNHVARYDADAQAAADEIQELCEVAVADAGEGDTVNVWGAADWLGTYAGRDKQRKDLGITAQTTDDELAALEKRLDDEAAAEGVDEVEGLAGYLRGLRDEAE